MTPLRHSDLPAYIKPELRKGGVMKRIRLNRVSCVLIAATMFPTLAIAKDRVNTIDLAQQNFKTRADAWGECIMTAAPRFLSSTESAEAIATAILGTCSAEQDAVQQSLVPIFGLTSPYRSLQQSMPYAEQAAANKITEMHNGFRDKLISVVVERRAPPISSGN
jgi:hypothetical protein